MTLSKDPWSPLEGNMDLNFSLENIEKTIKAFELKSKRENFSSFVKNTVPKYEDAAYLNYLFKELTQFYRDLLAGKSPRLIVNMPPRHLKSESITVRFGLFCALNNDLFEVISASVNQELANKFSRSARDIMGDEFVKSNYDVMIANNNKSIEHWGLTNKSSYKAVGMDGTTTGFGANLLIIDDPIRSPKDANSKKIKDDQFDWFDAVADTRMAPINGIIIVLTRWAEDDLAGRLIQKFPDDWKVIKFKAIAEEDEAFRKAGDTLHPKRYSIERMNKIRSNKQPHIWYSLYQQEPRVREGNLFKLDHFRKRYHKSELPETFDLIVTSWDFPFSKSSKSDFVAGVTLGLKGNTIYLLNAINKRLGFKETVNVVLEEYYKYKANATLIEARANGEAVKDVVDDTIIGLKLVHPCEDKVTRANAITSTLESEKVIFPIDELYTWWLGFINQLLSFPRAPHDDLVDAFTQAISYLIEKSAICKEIKDIKFSANKLIYKSNFKLWA